MDHTYDHMPGLDQVRRNSTISMARSMRVAKQERSTPVEREEKPRKQRKRALVAVSVLPILITQQFLTLLH